MTLIDLGEIGFQPPEPDAPPPPRWLRRLGVPARGKAAAVAALALLAGGLAGTAPDPGPQPQFHTIPAIDMRGTYWSSDGVVLQLSPDARAATATDLASGATLWSASWGEYVSQMDRASDGTILLQTTKDAPGSGSSTTQEEYFREVAQGHVVSVDPRTGAQRWRRPGGLLSPWEAREVIVLQPPAPGGTVGGAVDGGWRIARLDLADGRELWHLPIRDSTRWTFVYDNDFSAALGGLVLMDAADGSVTSVDEDGHATPRGRVQPGGTLEWAWSAYLAVSRPSGAVGPTDGPPLRMFALHDLRTLTEQPLWTIPVDMMNGGSPWPCGLADRLCKPDGANMTELSVRDGTFLGLHPNNVSFDEDGITAHPGVWFSIGGWEEGGNRLVAASPTLSKTGVAWLGAIRRRDGKERVIALMPVPVQLTNCWYADEAWLVCNGVQSDGKEWDRSLVLRRSDMDELLRRLGGP